jgi:hypothetical protein
MKRLIAVLILMFALPAFAGMNANQLDGAGWKNLTESQKADILKHVAQTAGKNDNAPAAEKVSQWVDIGERIGKMIGGVAKEVGVAVNEFVQTPVGKMAMVIIVWHYMGSVLIHVVAGLLILVLGLSFILYMTKRARTVVYDYDVSQKDIFGRSKLKSVRKNEMDAGYQVGYTIATGILIAVSLITIFSF